ncbi:MAG: glycosyltransferase [Candidatus Eisenbacteria bacterium]|nr:glycosyltransferase [Candidatus Eisenbacteria bacterium]
MRSGDIIDKTALQSIKEIGSAEVVVGVPSYNNARTIPHVVRAVSAGLAKYFPDVKAVLVNSDGGSTDGTQSAVLEAKVEDLHAILVSHRLHPIHKIVTPYHGIPGKGSALRAIIEVAALLGARAVAVVDSDLRSITPEWVELLVGPVLKENFDYVAPRYARHKYDGTITNTIVYPVTRALYGKRIRQPIGGDFGFSGRLAVHFRSFDVWDTDVARYGIDVWMTTTAVADGFKVCESFLGAKIHDPKDPSTDLSSMLQQVVGCVFDLMGQYEAAWKDTSGPGSVRVPLFGLPYEVGLEPVQIDLDRMIAGFRQGMELRSIWKRFLAESTIQHLSAVSASAEIRFPDELWARLVYDFSVAHHKRVLAREHVLPSITPLYLGKVASLFSETRDSNHAEVEARIETLCNEFEQAVPYLRERWRA